MGNERYMLLRRFTQHIKVQNWIAVGLDLCVVILGIFLAFQVERWYEGQRLKSQEGSHLLALLEDFREEKADLDWMIERYENAKNAALRLINAEPADIDTIDNDEFYRLIAESQRNANLEPRRQTYDALVATGAIESLGDENLKRELGAYFAFIERFLASRARWDSEITLIWEPFVVRNLDRNMLVRYSHPDAVTQLGPIHQPDRYLSVIGSDEFRSVLGKRWHFYRDRGEGLRQLRTRTRKLEQMIASRLEQIGSKDL